METFSSSRLSTSLRLAITRTARRLRQESGTGLSPSLAAALASVVRHGPLTPSELAERERIQRPAATRIAGRLVEAGLAQRTPDPHDGRSHLLAVTPEGRELIASSRDRKDSFLERRLARLSRADRQTLAEAAAILEELLEDEDVEAPR